MDIRIWKYIIIFTKFFFKKKKKLFYDKDITRSYLIFLYLQMLLL